MINTQRHAVRMLFKAQRSLWLSFGKDAKDLGSIPRPPNPTMEESFGTKFSPEQVEKFMNPRGFLSKKEIQNYEGVEEIHEQPTEPISKVEAKTPEEPVAEPTKETGGRDTKEYGFRVKGPEPTRYGDWERNGRCFDF